MTNSMTLRQVASALRARGFIVRLEDEAIFLDEGNPEQDLDGLSRMLKTLELKHTIDRRKLYIEEDTVPAETLNRIVWFQACNSESRTYEAAERWKYFAQRNHAVKIYTLNLDPGVAALCKSLSAAGVGTFMSCDGHGRRAPYILFTSAYHACWFVLLQKYRLAELQLAYTWQVRRHKPHSGHFELTAALPVGKGRWDLEAVLSDNLLLAESIYSRADELIRLRRELFGKRINATRRFVKTLEYEGLFDWMHSVWQGNVPNRT